MLEKKCQIFCRLLTETKIVYMGLKRGIMLLISALIISNISLIFSVVWQGVYGTTQQVKRNSKDQKGKISPRDQRHLQTACFETPINVDFFSVFGYILPFLDRVIVNSLKSTSPLQESRV